jgi:thymidylate synthase (FAD)
MTDITYLDDVEVTLSASVGSDTSIVQAARVSVVGENELLLDSEITARDKGLIAYLAREKHGSPFEHNSMTFYVKAPIFVFREFMRHRVGFSYNELSGRYAKLPAEFYVPNADRPLVNAGSSSKPELVPGDEDQYKAVTDAHDYAYQAAWTAYQNMLDAGIANEVARSVLPVGTYSQMYVTCNARSLMSFLSLRTHDKSAVHVSRPQLEIEMVARKMEAIFAEQFPITYAEFVKNGRVAP